MDKLINICFLISKQTYYYFASKGKVYSLSHSHFVPFCRPCCVSRRTLGLIWFLFGIQNVWAKSSLRIVISAVLLFRNYPFNNVFLYIFFGTCFTTFSVDFLLPVFNHYFIGAAGGIGFVTFLCGQFSTIDNRLDWAERSSQRLSLIDIR